MYSTRPLTSTPPFLFFNGPETVNDKIDHFCLPYHCPCGPFKPCSRSNETTAGSEFIDEKELNDHRGPTTEMQEESVEGDEYGLNNLFTTPNDFSTEDTVKADLQLDEIINWDGAASTSSVIPQVNPFPILPGPFQPPTTLFPLPQFPAPESVISQYQPVSYSGSQNDPRQSGPPPYQRMLRHTRRAKTNSPTKSTQPPIITPPMYQQALAFYSAVGPISTVQENMTGPTSVPEQYQTYMHYAQTIDIPNDRVPKRSFESMVVSDSPLTIAGPSKPPKRQQVHQFISVPPATHSPLPLTFSTHQNVLSVERPATEQPMFLSTPTATTPWFEPSSSTQTSNSSKAAVANKSSRKAKKLEYLAEYKRFLGSTYVCKWDKCRFTQSVNPNCEDRGPFERSIFDHFKTHIPRKKEFVCRWFEDGSMCGEVLRDTRGLIRHVYSIHQESKGKCDHCQMPFSRLEQLNQHMWDKCPALLKLQT